MHKIIIWIFVTGNEDETCKAEVEHSIKNTYLFTDLNFDLVIFWLKEWHNNAVIITFFKMHCYWRAWSYTTIQILALWSKPYVNEGNNIMRKKKNTFYEARIHKSLEVWFLVSIFINSLTSVIIRYNSTWCIVCLKTKHPQFICNVTFDIYSVGL